MEPNPIAQNPIQPPIESNSLPVGKKSLPKWPLIVIGVILLVIIIGGTYFLGKNQNVSPNKLSIPTQITAVPTAIPTPDPTADWKTFNSQKYAFSIKYPTDLNPEEFLTPFYSVTFKTVGAAQGELSTFDILANPDTFIAKDPAAYDWLSADMVDSFMAMVPGATRQVDTIIFTKKPDITVAGLQGTVINVKTTDDSTDQNRMFIKHSGNMYMIVNNQNSDQTVFNNFVSTLKFTDQASQAADTTNWKTYTSSDGAYSFKYPSDWTQNEASWNSGTRGQGISLSKVIDLHTAPLTDQIGINVLTYKSKGNLSAEEFLSEVYYQGLKDSLTLGWIKSDTMEPVTIGSRMGTKFNHMEGGAGDFGEGVWVSTGKDGLFIKLYSTSANNSEEVYKTVLSTFKFTQ